MGSNRNEYVERGLWILRRVEQARESGRESEEFLDRSCFTAGKI